jgi:hypothetical protein
MKRQQTEFEQLLECEKKVNDILKEYNCKIVIDDELEKIVLHDQDSNQFLVPFNDK